jgi:hypothetical protein
MFTIQLDWLLDVKTYLHIRVFPNSYLLKYKRIVLKALHLCYWRGTYTT